MRFLASFIINIFRILKVRRKNSILPLSTLRCRGVIQVGSWTTVGEGFWSDGMVEIGDFCSIGPNVSVLGTRHTFSYVPGNHRYLKSKKITDDIYYGKVIIGNNVFIGRSSVLLEGVVLGDNSIVGAGSIVTHSVPSNAVVAGNPAKIIRLRDVQISL